MSKLLKTSAFLGCLLLVAASASAFTLGIQSTTYHDVWLSGQQWDYVQSYNFYEQGAGGSPWGYWLNNGDVMSWTHTHDLNAPPDIVTDAYLKIEALYVDSYNNEVAIEGTAEWDNLTKDWQFLFWRGNTGSTYDLSALPQSEWADDELAVSIFASERLRIDRSTLLMNAEPGDPGTSVPEPATMLLFGFGLAGASVYRRVRK
jgi:hypothetical protein